MYLMKFLSIGLEKNLNGISVKALVKPEDSHRLRSIWFERGSTIGLRERIEEKWMLMRRSGTCKTKFGKVIVKQVQRTDGRYTLKPEFEELFHQLDFLVVFVLNQS